MAIGKRTLEEGAVIAGNRFYVRTGKVVNTAMVHPEMLPDGPRDEYVRFIGHLVLLRFRSNPWVAMGHVWVGVEEGERYGGVGVDEAVEAAVEADGTSAIQVVGSDGQGTLW